MKFSTEFCFALFLIGLELVIGSNFVYANDDTLLLGIFPRRNAKETVRIFKPMVKYLEIQLGKSIQIKTSKDFKSFWQGVSDRRYDIVHYNQYHYIISKDNYQYQVILKNNEFGESTIAGSIIVRKDSGINQVKDLKGKTIVFGGGPYAMQSYIVARYLLREAGLNYGEYNEEFAVNPPNAIVSAYRKFANAAGSGDKVLRLNTVRSRIDINDMKYLVVGEQLPHLPWAVKQEMDLETRQLIQSVLAGLHLTREGRGILKSAKLTQLIEATDSEYDRHRRIIKSIYGADYSPE